MLRRTQGVCLWLAMVAVLLSTGCEHRETGISPRVYFLAVDPGTMQASVVEWRDFHDHCKASSFLSDACLKDTTSVVVPSEANTYVATGAAGEGYAYVQNGDLYFRRTEFQPAFAPCAYVSSAIRFTVDGLAAWPSLSSGCGKLAYIDGADAYVVDVSQDPANAIPVNVGAADAVHISPDGTRLLVLRNDTLNVCGIDGTACQPATLPAGADIVNATFAPDSQHLLFVYPHGRVQVAMADFDGGGVQDLSALTNADAIMAQPVAGAAYATVQFGPTDFRILRFESGSGAYLVEGHAHGWFTFAVF